MDNYKIAKILKRHLKSSKRFLGVYSADSIPKSDIFPYSAIINTDKSGNPGRHWVSIYVSDPQTIEYFDSYGELPNSDIGKYLLNFEKIRRNKAVIQSIFSDVCGNYCIYFIIKRCNKTPYKKILKKLTSLKNPDNFVKNLFMI